MLRSRIAVYHYAAIVFILRFARSLSLGSIIMVVLGRNDCACGVNTQEIKIYLAHNLFLDSIAHIRLDSVMNLHKRAPEPKQLPESAPFRKKKSE